MAVAPECLLFYGLVLGPLLMLHCTVPSHVMFYITRRKVAKVYKPILAYLALLLLVLASVVAAEDMLRINVFSVCFGVVVAAFAYLFWRKYQSLGGENAAASMADEEEGQRQHQLAAAAARRERDATLSQYILKGYITPLFSLVMATQSKYSIIDDDGAAGTLRAGCSNACCSWGCAASSSTPSAFWFLLRCKTGTGRIAVQSLVRRMPPTEQWRLHAFVLSLFWP